MSNHPKSPCCPSCEAERGFKWNGQFTLRDPSGVRSSIKGGRDLKEDGVGRTLYSNKLCMRACGNDRAWLVLDELPYGSRREGQRSSHLAYSSLDFYPVAVLGGTLVGDVDICAHARLGPLVPCSDCHATYPVYDGGRDGAVKASVAVDVVCGQ